MTDSKCASIRDFAAKAGLVILVSASLIAAVDAAPEPPSLSKRGPDPLPSPGPPSLEEVFVTSHPRKMNEAQTIKEAFAKVKNGGVIFITQMKSDVSNDGTALIIDRPVTIALDPDLKTQMAIKSDDNLARASVNPAADGICVIVGQDVRGDESGRRAPRNEVTIRDIEFAPNPGGRPGTCIELYDGRLFLDNVAIVSNQAMFETGVLVQGGDLVTNERFIARANKIGIDIRAGAVEIADGAQISGAGAAAASAPGLDQKCKAAHGKYSMGVYASASDDARVGDPVVILRSATVSGFDFGVCAAGSGVSVEGARINDTAIGVRADRRIRITNARIGQNRTAALIPGSSDSTITGSDIYDSGVGAYLTSGSPPTFKDNIFAFNGTGIATFPPIADKRRLEEMSESFTANEVACNRNAGAIPGHKRFKKANRRYDNSVKICTGAKTTNACEGLRDRLDLSPKSCAAGN